MTWRPGQLKHWLSLNDSGVWGEEADGKDDVEVLRSTDISLDGQWRIVDPAVRSVPASDQKRKVLREGDLVVVTSSGSEAHLGKTAIVSAEVAARSPCFANFVQRLRPTHDADARFIRYFLGSSQAKEDLAALGNTTTGLRNLNGALIGAVVFPGPPLAEQRAIADYLDAETARIDALIAKKEQLIHLLEERFRSGLAALVTDHGAPRASTSSEWFGPLPEGWRCARLGSLTTRILDGPHVSPLYVDEPGIPFLSVRNIGLHGWDLSTAKFISRDDFEIFNRRIRPTKGDVLLTKGGNTGIARTVDLEFPFQVWVHVAILRPGHRLLPEFLTACLNSHAGYAQSQVWTRGASNQDLVLSRIAQIEIPVPPVEAQRRIVRELDKFYRKDQTLRSALRTQLDLLAEHRQALIMAGVTGHPISQLTR